MKAFNAAFGGPQQKRAIRLFNYSHACIPTYSTKRISEYLNTRTFRYAVHTQQEISILYVIPYVA